MRSAFSAPLVEAGSAASGLIRGAHEASVSNQKVVFMKNAYLFVAQLFGALHVFRYSYKRDF